MGSNAEVAAFTSTCTS
nr:unnamed protein product [Digitaria exilis]